MIPRIRFRRSAAVAVVCLVSLLEGANAAESLNILFVGNSYTGRHNLSKIVESMGEAGNPGLEIEVSTVIYGGRRLVDHWKLGTANFVRSHEVTQSEIKETIAGLKQALAKDAEFTHAKSAIRRNEDLLKNLDDYRRPWDVVVLQSYRDDLNGGASLYMEYAPQFTRLAREQGARVVLYETTPNTQNREPLIEAPNADEVLEKERSIAALADRIGANVAPMAMVALHCQQQRPELTLRFLNDGHLNHTMAYLTAATLYAAIFEKSPIGLPTDSVTDIRFFENSDKTKDRDGNPITRVFSAEDRASLQRIAWGGYRAFVKLRKQ